MVGDLDRPFRSLVFSSTDDKVRDGAFGDLENVFCAILSTDGLRLGSFGDLERPFRSLTVLSAAEKLRGGAFRSLAILSTSEKLRSGAFLSLAILSTGCRTVFGDFERVFRSLAFLSTEWLRLFDFGDLDRPFRIFLTLSTDKLLRGGFGDLERPLLYVFSIDGLRRRDVGDLERALRSLPAFSTGWDRAGETERPSRFLLFLSTETLRLVDLGDFESACCSLVDFGIICSLICPFSFFFGDTGDNLEDTAFSVTWCFSFFLSLW